MDGQGDKPSSTGPGAGTRNVASAEIDGKSSGSNGVCDTKERAEPKTAANEVAANASSVTAPSTVKTSIHQGTTVADGTEGNLDKIDKTIPVAVTTDPVVKGLETSEDDIIDIEGDYDSDTETVYTQTDLSEKL